MPRSFAATSQPNMSSRFVDFAGAGISSLCVLHCLALPVLAASLPIAGALAEMEWIHKGLVLLALPISGGALLDRRPKLVDIGVVLLLLSGLSVLLASAFAEALHDYETPLTVLGALLLTAGHVRRWRRHVASRRA